MKIFKNQSISLVKVNPETSQLCITPEAKNYLTSLANPVAIITIAGLYRTGKSYLVNKLLPNNYTSHQQSAFKVGITTQSMTKGLNILATPITLTCSETGQQIDYLLIDSEGIGSCEQSIKYDTDLLILIFLISSTVVYNSMGAIDQQGLEQLQVVLKLKNCVQDTEHQYQSCYFKYSSPPPKFIWVLRDFALQLIDKNGKQITSDQYLEQCLQESANTTSSEGKKKNQIRRAIKQNLGQRHCYTLVRPTIKEQDLQHLASFKPQQSTKIRAQFIGQLECLKQALFSGNSQDIKRINNQPITGKLFIRILSQYLAIINSNQLPRVNDVWNSVMKTNNEQFFQQLTLQLKKQIKTIKLPLPKEELKMKVNEIQNRMYHRLEKGIPNEKQLKSYHKEYLKIVQKLNKEVKQRNDELRKNILMTQLHQFVRENLNYESISITNISEFMKNFIQRMKLKINGSQEGYDYLMNIINDVFFIIEQKNSKTQREYIQMKKQFENLQLDKNNLDLTLINLKRQYHESLKTVARLQQAQADTDKNYILNTNKVMSYETKIIKLQAEIKQNKEQYERNLRQNQEKTKTRIEELSTQLKKVKEQYERLSEQNFNTKQKLNQKDLVSKKEIIFEEKIQEIYEKFQKEKTGLKKEIEVYLKQVKSITQKYQQMKDLCEKQTQRIKQIEEDHNKKQQNLMRQFENLKKCMKETKASYEQTYQTMQNSDQVLKEVNTIAAASTARKEKYLTPSKDKCKENNTDKRNQDINNNILKKYYECQMEKANEDHRLQLEKLQQKTAQLQKELERQRQSKEMYFIEAKQYKQKCLRLESDITAATAKFNDFLKELQDAKQKQRILYEQSILRLLNNMEKKENRSNRDSMTSLGQVSNPRPSSTSAYANRRNERQSYKDSVSFSHNFRDI